MTSKRPKGELNQLAKSDCRYSDGSWAIRKTRRREPTPSPLIVRTHSDAGRAPRAWQQREPTRHRIGGGFFVARRLVAATLLAPDHAAVVPFNRGSHRAATLSWADGDTTWADANCGVGVVPSATVPIVAVAAVPSDLNIDALGHLDALGLSRSGERGSRQHRCGCRQGKSDLHHVGVLLLGLDLEV